MRTKRIRMTWGCALALGVAALAAGAQEATAPQAAPTTEERVAAIKKSLVQSMQSLKAYEWLETTAVSFKGSEKSNTQNSCHYGADGKVVKTPVSAPAESDDKRGLRGKVIANKKEEMSEYMKSAVALIKSYVPPDPAKIQAAKDAGKVSMTVIEPGKRVKVDIKDYQLPGDNMGVELDMTTNQILGFHIATYLTDVKDAVTLDVKTAALADGTQYPSTIKLDAKAKEISVVVTQSGYVKKTN